MFCDQCRRDFEQCTCSRKGLLLCDWKFKDKNSFTCILSCCKSCSFCRRVATKERCKSRASKINKICERCFLCKSIEFCTKCHKCPTCCTKFACRGQITPVLEKMGSPRRQPQSTSSPQRRLHSSLPVPAQPNKKTHNNKLLCKSPQKQLPVGGIASAVRQKCCRVGSESTVPGLFLVPKPNNRWRPILDLSILNNYLKTQSFKVETPETIRTSLQAGEWVTSIDFKDAYFHIPINSQSRKYMRFQVQDKIYQFKALPFGLSTAPMEFTVVAKEVKFLAMKQGIRIHQYLDDWLVRARSHQTCLQHTQTLVALCRELGWLVNEEKSELEPTQVFNFVGYQFDLKNDRVRPTPEHWQALQTKIWDIMSSPVCPVRHLMSFATEKQVHLGRLHMRPIQWHLKNNWRVPETLEKTIPIRNSLHPHLRW